MARGPGTRHRATGDGWDGILAPGETILWQGRPGKGAWITKGRVFKAIFGAIFAGFAAVWMILASQAGGFFWAFGLIHFSVGLMAMGGALFGPELLRRYSWYTLTDRRAFIATDYPLAGRRLISYPVGPGSYLRRAHEDPDAVYVAQRERKGTEGHRREGETVRHWSTFSEIGFENLTPTEADQVYRLARGLVHPPETPTRQDAERSFA
ncbi:aspartate carbamoyltransferase catalytic subunit [Pseudooceanicola sp. 502str34]